MARQILRRGGLAALGAGALYLALIVLTVAPAEAQASRTRPGGSSGGSVSGGSSGGSSSGGGSSVSSTRPSGVSSGSPTVVDRRRPYIRSRDRHRGYYGYHDYYYYGGRYYPSYYWSPFRFGWWFGYSSYYPYTYVRPPGVAVYGGPTGDEMGALDTDVSPGKAEVYVNGQRVGIVDNYDGFPRYLWLEQGVYDVVFYREGYKTIARQYTIKPGVVIDVEDRMQPGESVRPEDLASKSTAVRDARLRERREQQPAPTEWRQRVRAQRAERRAAGEEAVEEGEAVQDLRAQPARLVLSITPADAAVYLNGEFLGTGDEVARQLIVDPGRHRLSIVRPGHEARNVEVEVAAGEETEVDVLLIKLE